MINSSVILAEKVDSRWRGNDNILPFGIQNSLAIVFPGQGSQTVGMLSELASSEKSVKELFDQASQVLGYDLWKIISEGPGTQLNQTRFTQPAMLVSDIALWNLWRRDHPESLPAFLAGHSLGEYAALIAGEVLSFEEGVKLVSLRASLMQDAVPEGKGAMGVILSLSDEEVKAACEAVDKTLGIVQAVNFNSPGQVVIAGDTSAVQEALNQAKQLGARRVQILPVSVPSHCSLMTPAALELAKALAKITFRPSRIPILHNVDASVASTPEIMKEKLIQQLDHPVQWVQTIEKMVQAGIKTVIECGPGKVLTGLNKRICEMVEAYSFQAK